MCRNIKTLYHFKPPATREEVEASALQYVRKLSGMVHPSKVNTPAFEHAVKHIMDATFKLFEELETDAPFRSRATEKRKAAERGRKREEQLREKYAK